jgi:hypothetical protein
VCRSSRSLCDEKDRGGQVSAWVAKESAISEHVATTGCEVSSLGDGEEAFRNICINGLISGIYIWYFRFERTYIYERKPSCPCP